MNFRKPFKDLVKSVFRALRIDVTHNMRYDRLTEQILRIQLRECSNAIDIGAHQGEILDQFLKLAPAGHHMAIEPIPDLAAGLRRKYAHRCTIVDCALSDHEGTASFQILRADRAYSGLRRRDTGGLKNDFDEVQVRVCKLDDLVNTAQQIDLIKIDVEGGEYDVLKGASELLKRDGPLLIFEFGKGAADRYGIQPAQMHSLLSGFGYTIHSLSDACREFHHPFTEEAFTACFESGTEYYFVARKQLT